MKRLLLVAAVVGVALVGGLLLRAAGPPAPNAPPVEVAQRAPAATPAPSPSPCRRRPATSSATATKR